MSELGAHMTTLREAANARAKALRELRNARKELAALSAANSMVCAHEGVRAASNTLFNLMEGKAETIRECMERLHWIDVKRRQALRRIERIAIER